LHTTKVTQQIQASISFLQLFALHIRLLFVYQSIPRWYISIITICRKMSI